ncbi:site-specific integrase [Clostridium sp.]|uniref:tyrosine-type recombinase/integrase n=1 Tax=Clostridium sp. TaxID=1506 RepID=UPI001A50E230|nr:site-specific integrase [Clostridium sp.]MBK5242395.1 site-specific integrase [Clostridium sp.]
MKKNDFSKYLSEFLSLYLPGQRNVSVNTIASYRDVFKLFLIFCESEKKIRIENITICIMTRDLIVDFLNWLEESRKNAVATRNQRLAALHAFFRYVQKESPENLFELGKFLEIPMKKKPKPMIPYLTANELKILLEQPDLTTIAGRKNLILLVILYDTGARVQELIDLKWKDVRLTSPAVITLHGKGNKTRQVPIMCKTQKLLESYKAGQEMNFGTAGTDHPLFYNQQHKKLSRWGISYLINKYIKKAKTNKDFCINFVVTPHVFRYSKAMHLLQAGVNLIYIRDFLGHSDINTTEIYARADSEMKRIALEKSYIELTTKDMPKWQDDGDLMNWLKNLCK